MRFGDLLLVVLGVVHEIGRLSVLDDVLEVGEGAQLGVCDGVLAVGKRKLVQGNSRRIVEGLVVAVGLAQGLQMSPIRAFFNGVGEAGVLEAEFQNLVVDAYGPVFGRVV